MLSVRFFYDNLRRYFIYLHQRHVVSEREIINADENHESRGLIRVDGGQSFI